MATTANFTRKQGEIFKQTITMTDADNLPIRLATTIKDGGGNITGYTAEAFFHGVAVMSGETDVAFKFKWGDEETLETGRGSTRATETGVFKVISYIPADNVGASGSEDGPVNSTNEMTAGAWTYVVRYADDRTPSDANNVRIIVDGTLTIEAKVDVISTVATYSFVDPSDA